MTGSAGRWLEFCYRTATGARNLQGKPRFQNGNLTAAVPHSINKVYPEIHREDVLRFGLSSRALLLQPVTSSVDINPLLTDGFSMSRLGNGQIDVNDPGAGAAEPLHRARDLHRISGLPQRV